MRSLSTPVAFVAVSAVVMVGVLLLVGATPDQRPVADPSAVESPAFWGGNESGVMAEEEDEGPMKTHGVWLCTNLECRFRVISGGKPFRSAAAQDCALCRTALVLTNMSE